MQNRMDHIVQQVVAQDQALQAAQVHTTARFDELAGEVQANRKDVSELQTSIQHGFANIEALLSKKHRSE